MTGNIFTSRTSSILVALCCLSLLTGLVLAIFQDKLETTRSSGADSFSRSAIGHRGFRLLLEEMGIPVIASRYDSSQKAGYNGVLVVAEPDLTTNRSQRIDIFKNMPIDVFTMLVILPKRRGYPDPRRPAWLGFVEPGAEENCDIILETMGIGGFLVQSDPSATLEWNEGEWDEAPEIDSPQLLVSDDLEPIIATENGTLLGYYYNEDETNPFSYVHIFVLSDPDLLANHGLGRGNNAAIAVKIVEYARNRPGLVVIDETLHGHATSVSSMGSFFRFPQIFVTLQILALTIVLLWMAGGRFGSPLKPVAARDRGHDFLIDNTADLLQYSGHAAFVLNRYFLTSVNRVCRRLHVDLPGSRPAARDRFINISLNRCPDFDFARMETEVTVLSKLKTTRPSEVLDPADAIYRWQQEMTNGL